MATSTSNNVGMSGKEWYGVYEKVRDQDQGVWILWIFCDFIKSPSFNSYVMVFHHFRCDSHYIAFTLSRGVFAIQHLIFRR